MVAPTGAGGERFAGGREPLSGRPMVAPTDWRKNVAGVRGKSLSVRRLPVRDDEQYTDRCRGKVFERSMGATDQGAPPVVFEWVPPPPFQGRRRTRAALSVGKRNRCRKNVKKGLQFARPGAILD